MAHPGHAAKSERGQRRTAVRGNNPRPRDAPLPTLRRPSTMTGTRRSSAILKIASFAVVNAPAHASRQHGLTALPLPERIRQHCGKQNQSRVAVRLEHRKAQVRIANVEPYDLPGEMCSECRKAEPEQRAPACEGTRKADQADGEAVENHEHRLGAITEQERSRLDADERVVLAILMGVDR